MESWTTRLHLIIISPINKRASHDKLDIKYSHGTSPFFLSTRFCLRYLDLLGALLKMIGKSLHYNRSN